ncbi:Uncharacterised protein [Mycobacteroides abscessus subsp. abscessus]|nr:Uncharacterised protein [Mycobacteroides abscessus subsp. abscessus]
MRTVGSGPGAVLSCGAGSVPTDARSVTSSSRLSTGVSTRHPNDVPKMTISQTETPKNHGQCTSQPATAWSRPAAPRPRTGTPCSSVANPPTLAATAPSTTSRKFRRAANTPTQNVETSTPHSAATVNIVAAPRLRRLT